MLIWWRWWAGSPGLGERSRCRSGAERCRNDRSLEAKMKEAAKKLDFEEAANLRDRVKQLRQKMAG